MDEYSANENAARIRKGLHALIAGRSIEFSSTHDVLIVVFDGPVNRHEGGRILLFQQFIDNHLGILPRIAKKVPGCIKVFFDLEFTDESQKEQLKRLLRSDDFYELCAELDISQLQFAAKMFPTKRPPG